MTDKATILNNIIWTVTIGACLLLSFAGCSRGPSADDMVAKATDSNVKRVAKMYTIFMKSHDWKGPQDANDLKAFISRQNPAQMRAMGIDPDNLDALFLDERDQQQLKVRWNLKGSMWTPPLPVVFEANASPDGFYQVGFTGSAAKQVDQAEYDRMWKGEADQTRPAANSRR